MLLAALSQSGEISPDFCCFYGGGIRHNEDIMYSFQNFIVRLIPNHPPPLETRIWKLVVRALVINIIFNVQSAMVEDGGKTNGGIDIHIFVFSNTYSFEIYDFLRCVNTNI